MNPFSNWQSSINIPEIEIKGFSFCILFVFDKLLYKFIVVCRKIYKEKGTTCSYMDADDLLKNMPSELDKYVFDKELQQTDDSFSVLFLSFCGVPDKIN